MRSTFARHVTVCIGVIPNGALSVLMHTSAVAGVETAGTTRIAGRINFKLACAVDDIVYTQAMAAAETAHDVELTEQRVRAVIPELCTGRIGRARVKAMAKIRIGPAGFVGGA